MHDTAGSWAAGSWAAGSWAAGSWAAGSWAAGVLPVSIVRNTPMVLLGRDCRDKGGKWSDFSGGGEAYDASPEATALRELSEETSGTVVWDPSDLENALVFRDTTPRGKTLIRFVVKVPYFGVSEFVPNDEKTDLRWFDLRHLPPMRGVFAAQMKRDLADILRYMDFED